MVNEIIKKQLIALIEDYRDFNCGPITVQPIPNAVEFAKQVSKGYPCIYQAYTKSKDEAGRSHTVVDTNLLPHPAFNWRKQDLVNLVDDEIEVAVTPTGRADDVHNIGGEDQPVFLAPASIVMTMKDLLDKLCQPSKSSQPNSSSSGQSPAASTTTQPKPIYYLQSQNSNLTTTPSLRQLHKQIPPNLPFAESVLSQPEATNIWIGDEKSITSTHRDPYENLYLVLKGSKTFTLYPPVDEVTLPTTLVRTGRYTYDADTNHFSTVLDEAETKIDTEVEEEEEESNRKASISPLSNSPQRIPWVTADPLMPRESIIASHEMYAYSSPRTVTVHEGQILYLPSGWYHHVQQTCGIWDQDDSGSGNVAPCIAVNYWYDMEYEGEKYVMRQLLGRLKDLMLEAEVENG